MLSAGDQLNAVYIFVSYPQIPGLGFVADILKNFLEWVEDNPGLGAVAFAAVYVFTTICFIPGALLTLGSGLVFGRALGTGLGVLVGSVAVLVSFRIFCFRRKGSVILTHLGSPRPRFCRQTTWN